MCTDVFTQSAMRTYEVFLFFLSSERFTNFQLTVLSIWFYKICLHFKGLSCISQQCFSTPVFFLSVNLSDIWECKAKVILNTIAKVATYTFRETLDLKLPYFRHCRHLWSLTSRYFYHVISSYCTFELGIWWLDRYCCVCVCVLNFNHVSKLT